MFGHRDGRWICLVVALLFTVGLFALPGEARAELVEEHRGVVVDARGRALGDVMVTAWRWNGYMGQWEPASTDVTDRTGEFLVSVRTWSYGCTYYYLTFERPRYLTVRMPEWDPDGGFYGNVLVELRCDVCVPEPMTVTMFRDR